ncbi:hypothetical protein A0H81_08808 [Grifola frondosa]|uniref:Uncharacterized protein n=1 Tax=Grifola frondosa TaxID=5627 RepID=A0A1C7M3G9_GRIFR|nr:hypothetical protein A0H81_08808 [Grifola frondosa]
MSILSFPYGNLSLPVLILAAISAFVSRNWPVASIGLLHVMLFHFANILRARQESRFSSSQSQTRYPETSETLSADNAECGVGLVPKTSAVLDGRCPIFYPRPKGYFHVFQRRATTPSMEPVVLDTTVTTVVLGARCENIVARRLLPRSTIHI